MGNKTCQAHASRFLLNHVSLQLQTVLACQMATFLVLSLLLCAVFSKKMLISEEVYPPFFLASYANL